MYPRTSKLRTDNWRWAVRTSVLVFIPLAPTHDKGSIIRVLGLVIPSFTWWSSRFRALSVSQWDKRDLVYMTQHCELNNKCYLAKESSGIFRLENI